MKEQSGINIKDLFWAICQKWRIIIIVALLFGILGGAYSYQKNKAVLEQESKIASVDEIQLQDYALQRVRLYLSTEKAYNEQGYYNENALLMQLDPSDVYVGKVVYRVSPSDVSLYKSSLKNQAVLDEIANIFGLDKTQKKYTGEMIDVDQLLASHQEKTQVNSPEEQKDGGIQIVIYNPMNQSAQEALEVVNNRLNQIHTELCKDGKEHLFKCISSECYETASNDLAEYQAVQIKRQKDYQEYIYNVQKFFTPAEEKYIEVYKEEQRRLNGETAQNTVGKATVSKKITMVSCIFGAMLTVFVCLLLYLFNGLLQQEDDLYELLGLRVIGIVNVSDDNKFRIFRFIDRFLEEQRNKNLRIMQNTDSMDLIYAGLQVLTESSHNNKLFVSCECLDEESKDILETLQRKMKDKEVDIQYGESILKDADALTNAAKIGQIVLVERIKKSKYSDIMMKLEQCKQYNLNVLGVIEIR